MFILNYKRLRSYTMASGIAIILSALQYFLRMWAPEDTAFLFVLPILTFVSRRFGRGPAILVLASGLVNGIWYLPPVGSYVVRRAEDRNILITYAVVGAFLCVYGKLYKRMFDRAETAETRLAVALHNSGIGVFDLKFEENYAFISQEIRRLFGLTLVDGSMDLDAWFAYLSKTEFCHCERHIHNAFQRGQRVVEQELKFTRAGFTRWYCLRIELFAGDGGRLGRAHGVMCDISERKMREKEQETIRKKRDEFLATLAHELRTPLAPLRQAVAISASPQVPESRRKWAREVIHRQIDMMSRLIEDLVEISRISGGVLKLRLQDALLSDLVARSVEIAQPQLDERGHRLTVQYASDQQLVSIDMVRMAQVIADLLINACFSTSRDGDIRLSFTVEMQDLIIYISDNGEGIAADRLGSVFDVFERYSSIEPASKRLGVGLALARGIVLLHNGKLSVASEGKGMGSTFTIRLPGRVSDADHIDANANANANANAFDEIVAPESQSHRPREPLRILVADDHPDIADSLAEVLRLDGHSVTVAYEGEAALHLFDTVPVDVALLDLGMPKMTGMEVARAIRGHAHGQAPTLVAITGWGQKEDRVRTMEAGFDHHLTKPACISELLGILAEIQSAPRQSSVSSMEQPEPVSTERILTEACSVER